MRFQWVVLGLAAGVGMAGCSACAEDKSEPDNGSAARGRVSPSNKSRLFIRPKLAAELTDGGRDSAPAPAPAADAGQ